MIINFYETKDSIIATKSSMGRPHFPYRQKIVATENYTYSLTYGENFYTLAAVVFGTDGLWWIIADLNPPKDVFSYAVGDVVVLPGELVKDFGSTKRIF